MACSDYKHILLATPLMTPLIMMVAAKRNDFEEGWGQCLAALVAAQRLHDDPSHAVYGVVSDGKRWEFGKLIHSIFSENTESYQVEGLELLFGAIHVLFDLATAARQAT